MDQQKAVQKNGTEASLLEKKIHRRKFFKFSSVAVASAAFIASCGKDDDDDGVNLGSGDTGVLNYAYALEQLESAF
ncbi:MAG: ferritin-like domain-containing protein, partial [Chitinophagaceae bacterium]